MEKLEKVTHIQYSNMLMVQETLHMPSFIVIVKSWFAGAYSHLQIAV